jgi:5-methylcytosine-specific restriction endonuclease McrA
MGDGRFQKGHNAGRRTVWIKKVCPQCAKEFEVKPSLARIVCCSNSCAQKMKPPFMAGRKHSAETKTKQRMAKLGIRGPEHWNYKNGNRSERKIAMARDEYKQWRTAVFERDNYTCQWCGQHGGALHADHIEPWSTHPDLRFEVDNGRTLCVPCHAKTPSFPKWLAPKELENGR